MKIDVGVLGATGIVGQKLVELLTDHPWFNLSFIAASDRSQGKKYHEVVDWKGGKPLEPRIAQMTIHSCTPSNRCQWVFSALDSHVAGEIETQFADAGHIVFSNAKNHRMNPSVPLIIPEVNPHHLDCLTSHPQIITNPNCAVIGLCIALKPLTDLWGINNLHVTTLQSISGAGYPGVSGLDILDNVIPFISGEEDKIENEPLKIFGSVHEGKIIPTTFGISAHCNRVPVIDGHLGSVSIQLKREADPSTMINAWKNFHSLPQQLSLPSAPKHPIIYFDEEHYPQPKHHRGLGMGMTVSIGRLRKCSILDWKFVFLVHNTLRGAAGGTLLNAELFFITHYNTVS